MIHGYARVSTRHQNLSAQHSALTAVGVERIWTETASGKTTRRPVLQELLATIRSGDILIVARLDRLGRSLSHLVATVGRLRASDVEIRSLHEHFDTTTAAGRLQMNMLAALAEFERDLIVERTLDGLADARAQGRRLGRPTVMTSERTTAALAFRDEGMPVVTIAQTLGISPASVYRIIESHDQTTDGAHMPAR